MPRDEHTYETLHAALSRKEFSAVYLFHGAEDYLADQATDAVINSALTKEERGFNLDIMYGAEADARDIVSHASSFPMMSERRVVVVREFDRLGNKELLSHYIDSPSPTTCLILLSTKPDFRKKPYLTARRNGVEIEFKPLYDNQIPSWIGRRIKEQGRTIDPEACRLLAAYVGTSLREIQNEIDKLYIYVGEKTAITAEDISAVVGSSREFNVFELQKAIGAKDIRRSTEILERMLDSGESATMIIVMLTRYFNILWKLYDLRRRGATTQQMASEGGVNPYFLKEYLDVLTRFTLDEIEHSFELLAAADERLKT
ncbi:MAG: DNA polymerase III subunit delta, partial [Ignavibacteriae bacterium]|nr:DNA polymerase III subunit delta [Ignavibacteriota bacterium]